MVVDICILNIEKTSTNSKMLKVCFGFLPKLWFNKLVFLFRIRADSQIYWVYSRDSMFLLLYLFGVLQYLTGFCKSVAFLWVINNPRISRCRTWDQFWAYMAKNINSSKSNEACRWQHYEWDRPHRTCGFLFGPWSNIAAGRMWQIPWEISFLTS